MAFALTSRTRGDELIASQESVVATSDNRESLEKLRGERAKERAEYLAQNPLPWWARACIIDEEEVVEVPAV